MKFDWLRCKVCVMRVRYFPDSRTCNTLHHLSEIWSKRHYSILPYGLTPSPSHAIHCDETPSHSESRLALNLTLWHTLDARRSEITQRTAPHTHTFIQNDIENIPRNTSKNQSQPFPFCTWQRHCHVYLKIAQRNLQRFWLLILDALLTTVPLISVVSRVAV